MTKSCNISCQNGSGDTGIIAKDAGGAELLSSYILKYKKERFIFYLTGPALAVFKRKNLIFYLLDLKRSVLFSLSENS